MAGKVILIRTRCKKCQGKGSISHWAWKVAYEECSSGELTGDWIKKNFTKIPPKEVKCKECNGLGYTEEWENISQLKKYIDEAERDKVHDSLGKKLGMI